MAESRGAGFPLLEQILEIARQSHMTAVSVALYDFASDVAFSCRASRVFHAASTIKLAILFALLRAAEMGRVRLSDRLHVRNRFRSQADGSPFFLHADRDGDPDLYQLVGRTASLQSLAETMIVRSSNLATNLLVDHLGVPFIADALAAANLGKLRCVRGVEDEAAHERGINNQVTADGLLAFFRQMHEATILRPEGRDRFFDILYQQRFNGMIPAGVPEAAKARVAHKTGEISTICHDAGMVFLPGRAPYVLVVLSEYEAGGQAAGRNRAVANISAAVYAFVSTLPGPLAVPVSP
jgi:beta-lactamase class A